MSTDELKEAYAEVIGQINDICSKSPDGQITGRLKERYNELLDQALSLHTRIASRELNRVMA